MFGTFEEWLVTLLISTIIIISHEQALKILTQKFHGLKMIWVMLFLSSVHVVQIWLYAVAIYISVDLMGLGAIVGSEFTSFMDFVYFSASNYTSLGYGDYIPIDELRLLATSEALVGLLMIGWSTAFAFWWMQRHWLQVDNKE